MASGKLNNLETLLEKESKELVEKLKSLKATKGKLEVKDIKYFTNQLRTLMEYYTSDNNNDSRSTLSIENHGLYQRMLIYGLHNFLPEQKKRGRKLTRRPEIDEAIGDGFTLDGLAELTDPKITSQRVLQYLNSTNQHEKWKKSREKSKKEIIKEKKKETLREYNESYSDLSREQLKKEASSLYQRIRKHGLLEYVPLRTDKKDEINQKILQDYKTNHEGKTRGQLQKEVPSLYQRMRNHDLLEHVPLAKPMSDEEILREYKTNHEGKTRGQLQKEVPSLYQRMRNHGLLEYVPLKRKIKPY